MIYNCAFVGCSKNNKRRTVHALKYLWNHVEGCGRGLVGGISLKGADDEQREVVGINSSGRDVNPEPPRYDASALNR
jgi:hypothetical protein